MAEDTDSPEEIENKLWEDANQAFEKKRFSKAASLYTKALQQTGETLLDSDDTVEVQKYLALCAFNTGDYDEAAKVNRHTLELLEAAGQQNNKQTATIRYNLARTLASIYDHDNSQTEKLEEAIALYRQNLDLKQSRLLVATQQSLAFALGKLAGTSPNNRTSRKLWREVKDLNQSRHNYASALYNLQDYEEAKKLFLENQKVLGSLPDSEKAALETLVRGTDGFLAACIEQTRDLDLETSRISVRTKTTDEAVRPLGSQTEVSNAPKIPQITTSEHREKKAATESKKVPSAEASPVQKPVSIERGDKRASSGNEKAAFADRPARTPPTPRRVASDHSAEAGVAPSTQPTESAKVQTDINRKPAAQQKGQEEPKPISSEQKTSNRSTKASVSPAADSTEESPRKSGRTPARTPPNQAFLDRLSPESKVTSKPLPEKVAQQEPSQPDNAIKAQPKSLSSRRSRSSERPRTKESLLPDPQTKRPRSSSYTRNDTRSSGSPSPTVDAGSFWAASSETNAADRWFATLRRPTHSTLQYDDPAKLIGRKHVRVAILDSGVDLQRRDMKRAEKRHRVSKYWNGNGEQQHRQNWVDEDGKKQHGTHCVSLLLQVAPYVDVFVANVLDVNGKPSAQLVAEAMSWAIQEKVYIISMSLGFEHWQYRINDQIDEARKAHVLVFAAACNDADYAPAYGVYPAWSPTVFSVNSSDGSSERSRFNPRHSDEKMNFMFLGGSIAILKSTGEPESFHVDQKSRLTGTSYATPIAAGIAALVLDLVRMKDWGEKSPKVERCLKTYEGMASVFRAMSDGATTQHGVYYHVMPWKLLGEEEPEPSPEDGPNETKEWFTYKTKVCGCFKRFKPLSEKLS